jgi:hypothetical protein
MDGDAGQGIGGPGARLLAKGNPPTLPCAMNSPGCKRIACTGDYKPAYTEARRQVDMTLANESECGGGW